MLATQTLLLVASLLLFLGVLAGGLSTRLGLPLLLVFLGIGMAAGQDGPGGIVFNDLQTTFLVGNLALAVILLDGGLRTRRRSFRAGLRPAIALATVGVAISAGIVGAAALFLLGFDWRYGLLLGAIVGSTDAAAVFALLRHGGTHLNERVNATLEIESGANDPMAVFLVLLMVGWIGAGKDPSATELLVSLVQQFGLGTLGGLLGGLALAALLGRMQLAEGLYALLLASGGLVLFAGVNLLGGSGFLAIYLCGVVVGNRRHQALQPVLTVMDGLAWLSQAGMFLLLGLLVTPSTLLGDLVDALLIALVLMFLARPLSVLACLLPFRFPPREITFVSWVGLRGAVPIVLAVFPAMAGLEQAQTLFNIAFVVVLASLLVQGSSISWSARRLHVEVPAPSQMLQSHALELPLAHATEIATMRVEEGAPIVGRQVDPEKLPCKLDPGEQARLLAIVRDGHLLPPAADLHWQVGDGAVYALSLEDDSALLKAYSARIVEGPLEARRFYGSFSLDAKADAAAALAMYGVTLPEEERGLNLADWMQKRLGRPLVAGDRVNLGGSSLVVQELDHGRVCRIGLKLPRGKG